MIHIPTKLIVTAKKFLAVIHSERRLALTENDIAVLVQKAEQDGNGKVLCFEPNMYPFYEYRRRSIKDVLFDIMNATSLSRVVNQSILDKGYNICVNRMYYLSI